MRWPIAAALFCAGITMTPRWWCGLDGNTWFKGDASLQRALASEVAAVIERGVSADEFTSSSALFRHEWRFGTYQMGALGLMQTCLEHPELQAEFLPVVDKAIEHLLSGEVRQFDAKSWGEDPLESLDSQRGHAAYLGYTNIVLGMHRRLTTNARFDQLNDHISAALARRLRASTSGILETYPGEAYPVDNASVLSSLLMHAKATGADHADVTTALLQHFNVSWRDAKSGLLFQAIDAESGQTRDHPRGSGTALAAYFISLSEAEVSRSLSEAVKRELAGSLLGFGFIKEYATGNHGHGDIDSGLLIFGISPSATGFMLGSCRAFNDHNLFVSLYRTAHLTGAPISKGNRLQFVTGGPLGNAIMLAMLTAQPRPK